MNKKTINKNFIRKNGLKLTKQRLLLSKILFSGKDQHFTAEDIRKLVLKKGNNMSLATIYNNLHHFVEVGLLKKRHVENSSFYFDNNITDHYHLFDDEKNTLVDIPNTSVNFSKLPKLPKNKKIKSIDLVINIKNR